MPHPISRKPFRKGIGGQGTYKKTSSSIRTSGLQSIEERQVKYTANKQISRGHHLAIERASSYVSHIIARPDLQETQWQIQQPSGTQMDFLPHSPARRRGRTTRHLFLLKLETKSAACDGPNGTHSLPGLVLALQRMSKTNNPGSRPRGNTEQQ
jgi:hypothetical protein